MKKLLFVLSPLFLTLSISAQDNPPQKEIGITFNNFNGFGLSFKKGTATSLWRFNSAFATGEVGESVFDAEVDKRNDLELGFSVGKEFRKNIAPKLELRYGFDASLELDYSSITSSLDNSIERTNSNFSYIPGINAVIGFNYVLKEKIIFGAEILPGIRYRTSNATTETISGGITTDKRKSERSDFLYGFSSNSALLSISFRF